jgi:Bacterial regulatory proteins, gntR family
MGQTTSAPPRPVLGDEARRAARLAKEVRLGPTYSKILLLIGGFLDAGHELPSWSELAAGAEVERSTARNAISEAERRGILRFHPDEARYEIRESKKKGGRRRR